MKRAMLLMVAMVGVGVVGVVGMAGCEGKQGPVGPQGEKGSVFPEHKTFGWNGRIDDYNSDGSFLEYEYYGWDFDLAVGRGSYIITNGLYLPGDTTWTALPQYDIIMEMRLEGKGTAYLRPGANARLFAVGQKKLEEVAEAPTTGETMRTAVKEGDCFVIKNRLGRVAKLRFNKISAYLLDINLYPEETAGSTRVMFDIEVEFFYYRQPDPDLSVN